MLPSKILTKAMDQVRLMLQSRNNPLGKLANLKRNLKTPSRMAISQMARRTRIPTRNRTLQSNLLILLILLIHRTLPKILTTQIKILMRKMTGRKMVKRVKKENNRELRKKKKERRMRSWT